MPGLPAADVIDLLLGVTAPADPAALAEVGFVPDGPQYASADPGRPARLWVRPVDSPGWRSALRLRDWLRADPHARAAYAAASGDPPTLEAAAAAWAASSGWAPSLNGTKPDG